jgi:hypothetical protein
MTIEHQTTSEEAIFWRLLEDKWDMLSEAARTVFREAELTAYAANMIRNYAFQPEEYEEAMDKMLLAAAKLKDREDELLVKLWCAALAASASIDPEDVETSTGYRVYRADLHRYYRMLSGMVEDTLQEKKIAELYSGIPF